MQCITDCEPDAHVAALHTADIPASTNSVIIALNAAVPPAQINWPRIVLAKTEIDCIDDKDVWASCPVDWLWVYDKLIVARKQAVLAAPAGIPVPRSDVYVVRPITNIRMMGRGARKLFIRQGDDAAVPDGHFWSEVLQGRHLSVDYHWGQQALTVEGFRNDPDRLDRFCRWARVPDQRALPTWLTGLGQQMPWINVEYIGDLAIEVHLRYNDDFANHNSDEIIPVWNSDVGTRPPGASWYASPSGDRLGFWTKNK